MSLGCLRPRKCCVQGEGCAKTGAFEVMKCSLFAPSFRREAGRRLDGWCGIGLNFPGKQPPRVFEQSPISEGLLEREVYAKTGTPFINQYKLSFCLTQLGQKLAVCRHGRCYPDNQSPRCLKKCSFDRVSLRRLS